MFVNSIVHGGARACIKIALDRVTARRMTLIRISFGFIRIKFYRLTLITMAFSRMTLIKATYSKMTLIRR